MARPESTRRGNSSSPFVRLSLTILYTWSNSFLVLELENESANSRIRYFVALRTLDWRPPSQPRAEKRFLFPRSLSAHAIIQFESPPGRRRSRCRCEKLAGELFRRLYFRRKFSFREQVSTRARERERARISRTRITALARNIVRANGNNVR